MSFISTTMANACHSVQSLPILGLNWTDHSRFVTILRHCAKTNNARCTDKTTCRLRLGRWSLKHCVQPPYLWSTLLRSTVHQFGVAVHTLASSIVFSTTHCALSLDACVQLQQTIYPSSQVFSRLSFAD